MRILFCSHYFPPEVNAPASRTWEHCRAWAEAGHMVTVITCVPNHPKGKAYPGYRNRLFRFEAMDGIRVLRVWTFLAANQGFLLRSLNFLSFFITASFAIVLLPRHDVFVSTSPQFFCGLTGLIARYAKRIPWVLEVRDLWPESIVSVGAMRRNTMIRLLERLEAFAYRRADRIVSVTDSFVPHIARRCGGTDKIAVIKNGVSLALFNKEAVNFADAKRRLGLEHKFVAAYVGTHGVAHGLETILDAAGILKTNRLITFLMVGDGAEREDLERKAIARELENVRILGQLPKSDMPNIWAAADACLVLLKRNDLFKKVIPSKMFEAMAMRCPIILAVEGEARQLLLEAGCGLAVTPENPEELAAAVLRLAEAPHLRSQLGKAGADYVREQFDREKLAARFLDLLRQTTAQGSRPRAAWTAQDPSLVG